MAEKYDHKAEFKAAYKKLGEDIQDSIERAARNGVPDLLIADQLLYVSLKMIVTYLEYGYEEDNVRTWTTGAYTASRDNYFGKPGRPSFSGHIHSAGGDPVSRFTEMTAMSIATRQAREELLEIARSYVGTLFPGELCGPIITRACELGLRARDASITRWNEAIFKTIERFEAGELRDDGQLLAVVANRSLSAGTRPPVE
ncbi:hypothetical protein [uncultured Devosia sp.]|uniref:hypothetical protein n=1 Tax=uncultured Devosia sp. TaxID=211434 RepID=UPI00261CF347|nr:hypothetical protein [uncultured Devosia sp.]